MKNCIISFLSLSFLIFTVYSIHAQRIGYYDGQYLLEQMPEYEDAKKELSHQIENWNRELAKLQKLLSKLKREYRLDKAMLTDTMKRKREKNIATKEKELRKKQSNIYGFKGLKYLKEQTLFQPMYDEIALTVRKVSRKRKINIMFDKTADLIIIYGNKKYDFTNKILEELKSVK